MAIIARNAEGVFVLMRNSAAYTITATAITFLAGTIWTFIFVRLAGGGWTVSVPVELLNAIVPACIAGATFSVLTGVYRRNSAKRHHPSTQNDVRFFDFFHQANDGMLLVEVDERGSISRIVDVNAVLCAQMGFMKWEFISFGKEILSGLNRELLGGVWEKLLVNGGCTFDWKFVSKMDRLYWYEVSASRTSVDGQDAVLGILRDVTERKRSERKIRKLAFYDAVTGLPNLRVFEERFYHELHEAKRKHCQLAVFVLDIDRFRVFNDTMGRAFGDKLLMRVAGRIKGCLSDRDLLVRMDGDDFRLLLPQIADAKAAVEMAEKLQKAFQDSYMIDGNEVHATIHIGIALYPTDGEDLETLYRCANFAMYHAIERSAPYQLYGPEMNPGLQQLMMIESDLKRAIQRGQFQMYYQPQVNLADGKMIGMEALIRWIHPEKGPISPTQFIPVAEETGMIIQIGEWVIREVCAQQKRWQNEGIALLPVAINLSMRQFTQSNIVDVVREALAQNDLSPACIVLEITESMTMNAERATDVLRQFRGVGVGIHLDDFGIGYSSLNYLKRFPLDKIKIDRSFVRDMLDDENDASIVSTIISLAHHLGLKVIAEGVEKQEQSKFLQEQRCDEVQGFYYSPPVPSAELAKMLKAQ
ncbi:MAG TPA: EAL domain-containing protein [Bacilli bacterium]